jgi:hypothetical protein
VTRIDKIAKLITEDPDIFNEYGYERSKHRKPSYSKPWSDPSKVKVVSDLLYYYPEGGRLFLVAEFEQFAGGPKTKFGFYTSRGESVAGTKPGWQPAVGIKPDSGWIMKIPGKYAYENSLLDMVRQVLDKQLPESILRQTRMDNKRKFGRMERAAGRGKGPEDRLAIKEKMIMQQIESINRMFQSHGVYNISTETPSGGSLS